MSWEDKYLTIIAEADNEQNPLVWRENMSKIISDIYSKGFGDGFEECAQNGEHCEEHVNYREMMQDLD